MMGMRRLVGFLMLFALAAIALPALAHYDDERFTFIMAPALSASAPASVTATVKNTVGDDDRIRSFKITAPAGVTVTSATIPGVWASNISIASGVVSVRNVNISRGNSLVATLGVTFPAAGCGTNAYVWGASAWENSNYTGDRYSMDGMSKLNTNFTGVCTFSLTGDTTVAAGSSSAPLTMTLTNNAQASGPAITAITLTPPAGVTIVSPAGGVITGLNVAGGTSAPINVTVATQPSCTASGAASWAVASVTPSAFVQSGANPKTTIAAQACSMSIATPTSAAINTDFSVTVGLNSGPGGANVTLTSTCGFTGAATTLANGYSAVFTGKVASPGTCTFNATADKGYPAATAVTGFKVFAAGSLSCGDPNVPTAANTIIGSASPSLTINDPGFAEGVRGQNINKEGLPGCVPVNWTFTNNVLGTGTMPDAKGNPVPANGVSFVWDQAAQPNAAYSYTVTWKPEWFGLASGVNRKTQFCADVAPNACNIIVNAQACLSPALLPSSIPGTDPACVSAEVWAVVGAGMCTGSPGAGQNACVIFTTTITDIKDPPIIRN
jgi:cell division septation protein DedD